MLRKFLETEGHGVTEGGTDPVPRPGDYELGSLESRAAARGLLDEKLAGDQRNRLRVVVRRIGRLVKLEMSTCMRYQYAGRNSVIEMVKLDGARPTETQSEQLDRWIRKVPINGQTYKFAEVSNG
jgi:hypothetical protein